MPSVNADFVPGTEADRHPPRLPARYRAGLSAAFALIVAVPSAAAAGSPAYAFALAILAFVWLGLAGLSSDSRYAASASLVLQGAALFVARFAWALPPASSLAWLCFIALQCFLRYEGAVAYLYSAYAALAFLAGETRLASAWGWEEALSVLGAYALACVGMEAFRRCRAQLAAEKKKSADSSNATMLLARANMELQKYAAQAELLAVLKERARLARDIHDTVGHALTSVILQIGAAQECAFAQARRLGQGLPPDSAAATELDERLASARQTAREGLVQIRASIKDLATPSIEMPRGPDLWSNVARAFSKATGVRVVENFGEDLAGLDEGLDEAVFRIIQECMTNAVRHGDARDIEIAIKKIDGCLCVRVCDNGRGAESVVPGQGLRGMRERVEALGGKLEWRSRYGYGFDLGADLPLEAASGQ